MIGNNTFIAGTADGRLSAWFRAPANPDGDYGMVRAAEFEPQGARVTAIAASTRDRTFATGGADGRVVLRHQTSQSHADAHRRHDGGSGPRDDAEERRAARRPRRR